MSNSPRPFSSYPFAAPGATAASETIGPDIIEVVIPFNSGTVDEAVSAAKAIVSDLTPDDIAGLVSELTSKATHEDLDELETRVLSTGIVNTLIFSN